MSEETEQFSLEELVVVNLKYSTRTRSQKTLALADLVAKVLYSVDQEVPLKSIRHRLKILLGSQVDEKQVQGGLSSLQEDKLVTKSGSLESKNEKWKLTKAYRASIKAELSKAEQELSAALARHFPEDIETEVLKLWFRDVSSQFFGHHGTQWLATINKGVKFKRPKDKRVSEFIGDATKKHNLDSRKADLLQSYSAFLSSENIDDEKLLLNMGLAMFSAKLVAAGIGVDPLTLEELKDAKFVLDTNFLLAIKLKNKRTKKALNALGIALKTIDATLVYTRTTLEEYQRVIDSSRVTALNVLENFTDEVIDEANDDEFVQSARQRGLKTSEDYENFFLDLRDLPNALVDGLPITLDEDEQIEQQAINAQNDHRLKSIIEKEKLTITGFAARPLPVEHDAALIYIARFLREEEGKCWILSFDRVLQSTALQIGDKATMPLVLSLEALIEILAINSAGPKFNATDFAPLMANILRHHFTPPSSSFSTTDLEYLHAIYSDASTLPKENIVPLVRQVNRLRAEGKTVDDPRFQARLSKEYNQQLRSYDADKQQLESRVHEFQEEISDEKKKNKHLIEVALKLKIRELQWRYFRKFAFIVSPRLIVIAVVALLIIHGARLTLNLTWLGEVIATLASLIEIYVWLKGPLLAYKNELRDLEKTAKHEINLFE